MRDSTHELTPDGKRQGGCVISIVMGFVLLLLAIVIAVGVGIIVFFAAGGNKEAECVTEVRRLTMSHFNVILNSVCRQARKFDFTNFFGLHSSPCTRTKRKEVVISLNYNRNAIQFTDGCLQSGTGAQGQGGGQEGVWWPDKECLTSCKLFLSTSSTSVIIKVQENSNQTIDDL